MSASEFSRVVDIRQINEVPLVLVATAEECVALAKRFGIVSVKQLEAKIALAREGLVVLANGRLMADVVQSCAISAEDFPVHIDEPIALRFVPATDAATPDEEIELAENDLDEVAYSGTQFDLGEEVAQGLALAIDPYAEGPGAGAVRKKAGLLDEGSSGPFAALAALKKQD